MGDRRTGEAAVAPQSPSVSVPGKGDREAGRAPAMVPFPAGLVPGEQFARVVNPFPLFLVALN